MALPSLARRKRASATERATCPDPLAPPDASPRRPGTGSSHGPKPWHKLTNLAKVFLGRKYFVMWRIPPHSKILSSRKRRFTNSLICGPKGPNCGPKGPDCGPQGFPQDMLVSKYSVARAFSKTTFQNLPEPQESTQYRVTALVTAAITAVVLALVTAVNG